MNDLVREHSALDDADLTWLHLLVADWQLLADVSFADLVLWVPTRDGARYVAVAQMRPNTGPTSYQDDLVGHVLPRGRRPLLDAALDQGRIVREGDPEWREDVPVRVESIPVRRADRSIAVIGRNTNLLTARTPSRLELTYLQTAADLARMIASGRFPDPSHSARSEDASPRVGDGMLRLDRDGTVLYASPNALSAFHRLGRATDLAGANLGRLAVELNDVDSETDPVDGMLQTVAAGKVAGEVEIEANGAVVQLRSIPLRPDGQRVAAVILARDATELRRRERELVTKDATIREIHHRVKNNLQTVAALLRLQARRLTEPGAQSALEEAERRVGSIAIVHETLSQTIEERVSFDEIADRILNMVVDVSRTSRSTVTSKRFGSFGELTAQVATPLAMVLTELVQNALEHGLTDGSGAITVRAVRAAGRLSVEVQDDGRGLPPGFDPLRSGNLGLQIVRTLAVGELGGRFDMRTAGTGTGTGTGTVVTLDVPVPEPESDGA